MTWFVFGVAWIGAFGFGIQRWIGYETTAGRPTRAAGDDRPRRNEPLLDPSRPTLLLFAHPLCPCTRASRTELTHLHRRFGDRLFIRVVTVDPADDRAAGSRAARRFGARTSGQTMLFDAAGRLLFRGGITPARGESGPSKGGAAIRALLDGPGSGRAIETPVFGCSLFGDDVNGARP